MKRNSTAIVGMSLWNSYFSEENVHWLLGQVRARFADTKVMIPDQPTRYTYLALWVTKLESKIVSRTKAIRNKVMSIVWIPEDIIIDWKTQISEHPAYWEAVKELMSLAEKNDSFRFALENTTKDVLEGKTLVDQEKIKTWTMFLVCELAFLISAKEILWTDVTYVYHRDWPIFTDLISGKFDGKKREVDFEKITKEA